MMHRNTYMHHNIILDNDLELATQLLRGNSLNDILGRLGWLDDLGNLAAGGKEMPATAAVPMTAKDQEEGAAARTAAIKAMFDVDGLVEELGVLAGTHVSKQPRRPW